MGKVNNPYIKVSIANQMMIVSNFKKECEISAKKNDGIIDNEERKFLKKINKYSEKYERKLKKLMDEM